MFYKIEDFKNEWKTESEATLKIFSNLTDESLNQEVYEGGRSIKDLAWHITNSLEEMLNTAGIPIEGFDENQPAPNSVNEIKEIYEKYSEAVVNSVTKNWKDENLKDEINMYGEMWSKGLILSILIVHQIHHRAQITVLMRQAGLKVPGIYGPSKEEWQAMGMEAEK